MSEVRKVKASERRGMRIPRSRWGGRWLAALSEMPVDGGKDFYALAEYGKTVGYQVARELNLASTLPPGRYEFGTIPSADGEGSVLVARRLGDVNVDVDVVAAAEDAAA